MVVSIFFYAQKSYSAICVYEFGNTTLRVSPDQTQPCIDPYVVLTVQDYEQLMASPTLQDIFQVPLATDLAQLWLLGFSLPIILYLTSWGYGVVVNFFNPDKERY